MCSSSSAAAAVAAADTAAVVTPCPLHLQRLTYGDLVLALAD
jgi:hypothetical protein